MLGGLTFLTPATGLIAAGLSLPALLVLYFLKLRRAPVRVSSNLLWESAVRDMQVNAPFRWLRFSVLLVVQVLVLGLLCGALARPALEGAGFAGGRVIVLLDHGATMSALDGEGGREGRPVSRLEEAKRKAGELVDRLAGGSAEMMVIAFADRASPIASFTRDRGMLKNAIDAVPPTDQPARLGPALKVVEAFVGTSDEGTGAREPPTVVLVSDGGAALAPEAGAGAGWGVGNAVFRYVRAGPAAERPKNNVGIVAMSARRDYDDPGVLRVFVRVQSALAEAVTTTLALTMNDRPAGSRAIEIGAGGEISETFEVRDRDGGVLVAALSRGDDLASDNAAAVAVQPPGDLRIVLVQPAAPATAAEFALVDGLKSLEPRELRQLTADEYEKRRAEPGFFDGVSLAVFDRVRPGATPPVSTLSFAAGPPLMGLGVAPFEDGDGRGAVTDVVFWSRSHPLMRFVSLNGVVVGRPMRLLLPGLDESGEPGGPAAAGRVRSDVLASGSGGPLIGVVEEGLSRHVVCAFSLADTNLWRELGWPVLLANAADTLGAAGPGGGPSASGAIGAGRGWRTTDAVELRGRPGQSGLRLEGPAEEGRTVSADEDGRVRLGVLSRAGVYRVRGLAAGRDAAAVNVLSGRVTSIATSDAVEVGGKAHRAGGGGDGPREIWWWFVAAALGVLTVEWLWFARRMRV
ncbi:MAG: VWA domain-containing protein [Phycisphaerales bacterium]|nr:VWA domain-containing protein [Phycisphaerales bacterium]